MQHTKTGDEFHWALRWSIIVHAVAMILIIVQGLIFPKKQVKLFPALRVDLVGLPDYVKKEMENVPAPTETVVDNAAPAKAVEAAAEKSEKSINSNAMVDSRRLEKKNLEKIEDLKREQKMQSALNRIKALNKISDSEVKAKNVVIKGNQTSPGASLSDDAREAQENTYYDLVRNKLQENWALPAWLSRQELSAQVLLYIDRKGMVRGIQFQKSSGNGQFDDWVRRTILASQPLPIPAVAILQQVMVDGILVGFPL